MKNRIQIKRNVLVTIIDLLITGFTHCLVVLLCTFCIVKHIKKSKNSAVRYLDLVAAIKPFLIVVFLLLRNQRHRRAFSGNLFKLSACECTSVHGALILASSVCFLSINVEININMCNTMEQAIHCFTNKQ